MKIQKKCPNCNGNCETSFACCNNVPVFCCQDCKKIWTTEWGTVILEVERYMFSPTALEKSNNFFETDSFCKPKDINKLQEIPQEIKQRISLLC